VQALQLDRAAEEIANRDGRGGAVFVPSLRRRRGRGEEGVFGEPTAVCKGGWQGA